QHRGQESAGIATSDGHVMRMHKDMGLVAQAFDADALERLTGHLALGHTRYSTTGSNRLENAQPIIVEHPQLGSIAIAHNGNLTNTQLLRDDLEQHGVRFKTSSDTEVLAELVAHTSGTDIVSVLRRALAREAPAEADIVISLPDSGTPAAVGFAEASGIPYSEGLIKSRYITRTFIQPNERLRNIGIKLKFNPLREILEGKRVVLVDDSIVRGTTSRKIVEELRRGLNFNLM